MLSNSHEMYVYNCKDNLKYRKRRHSVSSDDDVSSPKSHSPSVDDDRRAHHNELERRRRDHIKDHFMILKDSIPLLDGEKSSRALILKRAVEYITVMQSRLNENQRSIEELRRRNELLEEKLKEREPSSSTSPVVSGFITPQATPAAAPAAPQPQPQPQTMVIPPMTFPTFTSPVPQTSSAAALSTIDPIQLNSLLASSQEAILKLTQTLIGKIEPNQVVPPEPLANPVLLGLPDRQMSVRF